MHCCRLETAKRQVLQEIHKEDALTLPMDTDNRHSHKHQPIRKAQLHKTECGYGIAQQCQIKRSTPQWRARRSWTYPHSSTPVGRLLRAAMAQPYFPSDLTIRCGGQLRVNHLDFLTLGSSFFLMGRKPCLELLPGKLLLPVPR